eukprot:325198-Hanusia_phi.AAC.3
MNEARMKAATCLLRSDGSIQMFGRHQFASLLGVCIAAYLLYADSPTMRHVDEKLMLSEQRLLGSKLTNGATPKDNVSMHLNVDYGNLSPEEEETSRGGCADTLEEEGDEAGCFEKRVRGKERLACCNPAGLYRDKLSVAELLERLSETNRARNVVIAILTIIVLVTVLIDFSAHKIHSMSSHFSKPVIETLFKELTVLGCIALLVFMSVKTGLPQQISTAVMFVIVNKCKHAHEVSDFWHSLRTCRNV